MFKTINFKEDAREELKKGLDIVANSVKVTLGPRGRNVIISNKAGYPPRITNDGRTIADNILLEDPTQNTGAEIAKVCARKTDMVVGDATTTTIVLLQSIIYEGMERLNKNPNISMMKVREGIEIATEKVLEELNKMSIRVDTPEMLRQVATLSVEDPRIGEVIADTIEKIGPNGFVTVEEHEKDDIEVEITEGMRFEKGCIDFYLLTDFEKMTAEYRDIDILVINKKIITSDEIRPFMERLMQAGRKNLVIIADDIDGEALATFKKNKVQGIFNTLAIRAPGTTENKHELLQDIAIKCGAVLVDDQSGISLDSAPLEILGHAKKIISNQFNTTIIGGSGDIKTRLNELTKRKENSTSKYEKTKLEERIAQISGKIAVIKVGGITETERKYKKDKIDDAVNSTKNAIKEGIVPGGGSALVKAGQKVKEEVYKLQHDSEILTGFEVLLSALKKPMNQIGSNSGRLEWQAIQEHTISTNPLSGYNALTNKLEDDMIKAGVIDPTLAVKTALINASRDGALFLTTDVSIVYQNEKEPESQI